MHCLIRYKIAKYTCNVFIVHEITRSVGSWIPGPIANYKVHNVRLMFGWSPRSKPSSLNFSPSFWTTLRGWLSMQSCWIVVYNSLSVAKFIFETTDKSALEDGKIYVYLGCRAECTKNLTDTVKSVVYGNAHGPWIAVLQSERNRIIKKWLLVFKIKISQSKPVEHLKWAMELQSLPFIPIIGVHLTFYHE